MGVGGRFVGRYAFTMSDSSSLHSGIAGATAGVVSRIVSAPLDVLKIRFQLQVEPIKKVRISTGPTRVARPS